MKRKIIIAVVIVLLLLSLTAGILSRRKNRIKDVDATQVVA